MNETITVSNVEQLQKIYLKLAEVCSEVIKLPVEDCSSREMDVVGLHLRSIVISLELRGLNPDWMNCN